MSLRALPFSACFLVGCLDAEEARPVCPSEVTWIAPPVAIMDEPVHVRPPSVSLGYIGDGRLTPSGPGPQRWPWVQERFAHDPWRYTTLSTYYGRRW